MSNFDNTNIKKKNGKIIIKFKIWSEIYLLLIAQIPLYIADDIKTKNEYYIIKTEVICEVKENVLWFWN